VTDVQLLRLLGTPWGYVTKNAAFVGFAPYSEYV
jgi:hypothetical protein